MNEENVCRLIYFYCIGRNSMTHRFHVFMNERLNESKANDRFTGFYMPKVGRKCCCCVFVFLFHLSRFIRLRVSINGLCQNIHELIYFKRYFFFWFRLSVSLHSKTQPDFITSCTEKKRKKKLCGIHKLKTEPNWIERLTQKWKKKKKRKNKITNNNRLLCV